MTEADANAMLGDLLMHLANPKGARALFEHAVTLDESQPLALARLAQMSAGEGASDRARELSARASRGASGTFLSHFYVGEALEQIARRPPRSSSRLTPTGSRWRSMPRSTRAKRAWRG